MRMGPTVVDLYSGCGGLSWGLERNGFRIVCGVDNWDVALRTFEKNHSHAQAVSADLATLDGPEVAELLKLSPGTPDVVVGGRPAKVFRQQVSGDAATLATPSLVGSLDSLPVSVRRFLSSRTSRDSLPQREDREIIELLDPLIKAGYRIHLRKINAANFGVPQHRKRVIAIGALGWDPQYPEPTHSAYGAPGARLAGCHLPPTPTLGEALASLPPASKAAPGETRRSLFCPPEGAGSRKSPKPSGRARR